MAWLSGYLYRKAITLTGGSSGAQTYYQLKLAAAFVTDHMQPDFDDLRFTDADGNLIDAWLEDKTDSTSADVWVKFPSTPANGETQTYYMYYGKSDAVNYWDGGATFAFFDDFSDDLSNWDTANAVGTWSIESDYLRNTGTGSSAHERIWSLNDMPDDIEIVAKLKLLSGSDGREQGGILFRYLNTNGGNGYLGRYDGENAHEWFNFDEVNDGSWTPNQGKTNNTFNTNVWYDVKIRTVGSNHKSWYKLTTDTNWTALSDWTDDSHISGKAGCGIYDAGGYSNWDNIRVRKYAANPPTYGFGSEESAPSGGLSMAVAMHHLRQQRIS